MPIFKSFPMIAGMAGLMAAMPVVAQEYTPCAPGRVMVTSLGIGGIACDNCTLFNTDDPRDTRWEFGSEPVIETGQDRATGNGLLRPGDVIVAIDGHLITTIEGGRRFAHPEADRPADVRIRRSGRELSVAIDPRNECRRIRGADTPVPPDVRTPTAAPPAPPPIDSVNIRGGRASVFPSPARPILPTLLPAGWLGFSFQCSRCQVRVEGDSMRAWTFAEPPTVVSVEAGSPSARAGLQRGDRIVSIDGLALTTAAGGERFGAVAPGQSVEIGYQRGSRTGTVDFVAGNRALVGIGRPGPTGATGRGTSGTPPRLAGESQMEARVVRYTGQLGDAMIEVTGEPVTVFQDENEIVIRSSTITIRLRKTDTGG